MDNKKFFVVGWSITNGWDSGVDPKLIVRASSWGEAIKIAKAKLGDNVRVDDAYELEVVE